MEFEPATICNLCYEADPHTSVNHHAESHENCLIIRNFTRRKRSSRNVHLLQLILYKKNLQKYWWRILNVKTEQLHIHRHIHFLITFLLFNKKMSIWLLAHIVVNIALLNVTANNTIYYKTIMKACEILELDKYPHMDTRYNIYVINILCLYFI